MSSQFPTSIDNFSNPTPGTTSGVSSLVSDQVGSRTHAQIHGDVNDAIVALEAKVGVNSSAVTTSHDYKLSGVTGSDKAASLAGTESLTNKSLTSPKVVTGISDTNGNELVKVTATGSAVNEVTVANAATGNNPNISATGDDSNIGIDITPKGTGTVNIKGNSTQAGTLRLYEDTDDGSNYTSFKVGAQSGNLDYTLPTANASGVLTNNGSGGLSWAASTSSTCLSVIPRPGRQLAGATTLFGAGQTTTLYVSMFDIPFGITVNKISWRQVTITTSGTYIIALFSEDGQTRHINVTTASISSTGIKTHTLGSPVVLGAGSYYFCMAENTAVGEVTGYGSNATSGYEELSSSISGEPILEGTLTITAGTMPATISPTGITASTNRAVAFRLDN